jgi:hypothetical protein
VIDGRAPRLEYEYVPGSVDEALPLIYRWETLDEAGRPSYRYIGKAIGGSRRPRTAYQLNVTALFMRTLRPFALEKTLEEIYVLYQQALPFVQSVHGHLRHPLPEQT